MQTLEAQSESPAGESWGSRWGCSPEPGYLSWEHEFSSISAHSQMFSLSVCLSVSVQGLWSGGGMGNLTLAALLRSFLVGDTGEG